MIEDAQVHDDEMDDGGTEYDGGMICPECGAETTTRCGCGG